MIHILYIVTVTVLIMLCYLMVSYIITKHPKCYTKMEVADQETT